MDAEGAMAEVGLLPSARISERNHTYIRQHLGAQSVIPVKRRAWRACRNATGISRSGCFDAAH